MNWTLEEALTYYRSQGAPRDQMALVNLLKEMQKEQGGTIPMWMVEQAAAAYEIKPSYLLAVIRRYPSLRLTDSHCLELCGGPNCSKAAKLADFVERTYGTHPKGFELRYTGCMRMCGRGPNIRWDGEVFNRADEDLIRRLTAKAKT